MKALLPSILFLCSALILSSKSYSQDSSETSKNLYFGQKPPGMIAELFAADAQSSKGWRLSSDFTPDINEFYMTHSNNTPLDPSVIVFRKENNVWKKHNFHSALSGDSNILYDEEKYIEKTDSGWSEIKSLGPMFDRDDWGIMRLSASAQGTFVFDDYKNNDVIRISRIKDGIREEPKLLGKEINTGKWTAHPFIAHDESYLIWDSERDGGYGGADIYISFRQKDGSWGTAINMGDKINSALWENGAMVTPDGKYLFFGRSEEKFREDGTSYWEGGKYWVDAQIIETLRPKPQLKNELSLASKRAKL